MNKTIDEAMRKLSELKETYVRAWIAETGLHPTECELVQETRGQEIVWYVRARSKASTR